MKTILLFLIISSVSIIFYGCATAEMIMEKNNENLLKLEMGMSKEQVLQVMGCLILMKRINHCTVNL